MTKQFCGQIGQISQQINAVVMGLAGAERIFALLDEEPETAEGYVSLVNAQVNPETWEIEEADHHTGLWAWKHPHRADGTVMSISGLPLSSAVVVPFLNMTKQFCGQIGQISQQINAVVMGLAGAERIFALLDEEPETAEGYVSLVNAQVNPETWEIEEADHHTGLWAWKHPHRADGTVTYEPLRGDVQMDDVDFGYTPEHVVLHGVSGYAKRGQKVPFVGATGAG